MPYQISENTAITVYDHDPNTTAAVDVTWVDCRDYHHFAVVAIRTVGTGDVDGFSILGNSESSGVGDEVTIVTHALASQPNALADFVYLECSFDDVNAAATSGEDIRYLSASLQLATATDEFLVCYIRSNARHKKAGLTADIIS